MADNNFVNVNIIVNSGKEKINRPVKFEVGCSFENNGKIYQMGENKKLNVFDKAAQKWVTASNIEMNSYQYDTFKAVANNKFERTNGEIKDIILSKEDIDRALNNTNAGLKNDLQQFLTENKFAKYAAEKIKKLSNGFSAYITNGVKGHSANLIFGYGSAKDAIAKSNSVNHTKLKVIDLPSAANPAKQKVKENNKKDIEAQKQAEAKKNAEAEKQRKAIEAKKQAEAKKRADAEKQRKAEEQRKAIEAKKQAEEARRQEIAKELAKAKTKTEAIKQAKLKGKAEDEKRRVTAEAIKQRNTIEAKRKAEAEAKKKTEKQKKSNENRWMRFINGNTYKPQISKTTAVKPSTLKPARIKPTAVKPSAVKPSAVKSAGVKSAGVKSAGVKSARIKQTAIKPSAVKSARVKSAAVKQTAVKPTITNLSKLSNLNFSAELRNIAEKTGASVNTITEKIKNISRRTGFSVDLITLVIANESFTQKAEFKERDGCWEVGFGHTNRANHNKSFVAQARTKKGFTIDLDTAFKWFEQDLIDKHNYLKYSKLNTLYDYTNLPKSLQEAFIDTAFNRGEGTLTPGASLFDKQYKKLRDYIKKKDYASAAVYLRQRENRMKAADKNGLRKRNLYRFLIAIRDLAPLEKYKAMKLFKKKNSYYVRTIRGLHGYDRIKAEMAWENVEKNLDKLYG